MNKVVEFSRSKHVSYLDVLRNTHNGIDWLSANFLTRTTLWWLHQVCLLWFTRIIQGCFHSDGFSRTLTHRAFFNLPFFFVLKSRFRNLFTSVRRLCPYRFLKNSVHCELRINTLHCVMNVLHNKLQLHSNCMCISDLATVLSTCMSTVMCIIIFVVIITRFS